MLLLSLYPRSRIETTLTVHEVHYLEHFIFTSFRSPSPPRRRKKRYRIILFHDINNISFSVIPFARMYIVPVNC